VHELATAIAGADVVVFTAGAGEQDDESMIDARSRRSCNHSREVLQGRVKCENGLSDMLTFIYAASQTRTFVKGSGIPRGQR
jgi:hypothetical protein